MVTEAHAEPVRARRHISEYVMPAVGLTLVALVVVWLAINLADDPARFFRVSLIGLSQDALYALVDLGYTLVYGILELINFAHGDVFMIGGMITASIVLQVFNMQENPAFGILIAAFLVSLVLSVVGCAGLNATVERFAYKPLRGAPRLAPLITAIGVSFSLENIAILWKGTRPVSLPVSEFAQGRGTELFTIGTCPDCAHITSDRLFVILVTVPVLLALLWVVRYTRQGKAMRAT